MTVNWGYTGDRGPEHWHTLSERFACGLDFEWQSPIGLSRELITQTDKIDKLDFHYQEEVFVEETFNNSFHLIPPEKQSYVVFENEKYHLTDIHFHLPSEHTLEDKQYPIEFHFVHMPENPAGHNLVIGVLFNIESVDKLVAEKPVGHFDWNRETREVVFNPFVFMPTSDSFYHYTGSLTTPPTIGPINWFVYDTVKTLSKAFVDIIRKDITPNNNRPLQDIKGRDIWHS